MDAAPPPTRLHPNTAAETESDGRSRVPASQRQSPPELPAQPSLIDEIEEAETSIILSARAQVEAELDFYKQCVYTFVERRVAE